MSVRKSLLAIAMPMALVACTTTAQSVHRALPPESAGKFASTEVVVPIFQNDLYMIVPQSNAAIIVASAIPGVGVLGAALLGGMAGALDAGITSANAGGAQAQLKPIRDAMPDFRFDEAFQAELTTALAQTPGLNTTKARVVKEVTNEKLDGVLDASTASGVLFVTTDYQLSQNAETLMISVSASLFPKSPELQGLLPPKTPKDGAKTKLEKALYRGIMIYQTHAPNATSDRSTNIAAWAANNGEGMRNAMKHGQAMLAQMVASDLAAGKAAEIDPKTTKFPKYSSPNGVVTGYVVRTDADGGQLIAFPTGVQTYLTKNMSEALRKPSNQEKQAAQAITGEPVKKSARQRAAEQKSAEKERKAKAKEGSGS